MQKITLISVGRLKEEFFKAAEKEYAKRLGGFCDLKIIEVNQQQQIGRASCRERV